MDRRLLNLFALPLLHIDAHKSQKYRYKLECDALYGSALKRRSRKPQEPSHFKLSGYQNSGVFFPHLSERSFVLTGTPPPPSRSGTGTLRCDPELCPPYGALALPLLPRLPPQRKMIPIFTGWARGSGLGLGPASHSNSDSATSTCTRGCACTYVRTRAYAGACESTCAPACTSTSTLACTLTFAHACARACACPCVRACAGPCRCTCAPAWSRLRTLPRARLDMHAHACAHAPARGRMPMHARTCVHFRLCACTRVGARHCDIRTCRSSAKLLRAFLHFLAAIYRDF